MSDEPKKLPVTVKFGGFDCDVYRTSYPAGGATALYLTDRLDGGHVATATVNVPEANPTLGIGAVHRLMNSFAPASTHYGGKDETQLG